MPDINPRKFVTLSREAAKRIDDYRWGNRIGSESEALRRLIDMGLDQIDQGPNQQTRSEDRAGQ